MKEFDDDKLSPNWKEPYQVTHVEPNRARNIRLGLTLQKNLRY